jgi:hypothetical protein
MAVGKGSRGGGNGEEGGRAEEEVSVGFVAGDRLAAMDCLGRGGESVARI